MYNGYKNYETWNVALWIDNDEGLYNRLVAYAKRCKKIHAKPSYSRFIDIAGLIGEETGDSVSYINSRVCRSELSNILFEGLLD
jgi:hypothetical protein